MQYTETMYCKKTTIKNYANNSKNHSLNFDYTMTKF